MYCMNITWCTAMQCHVMSCVRRLTYAGRSFHSALAQKLITKASQERFLNNWARGMPFTRARMYDGHIHMYTVMYVWKSVCKCIHIYIKTHIHTYTYINIHTNTYTYIHIHTHAYTYIHSIHIHTYTYIYIHIHTYTYINIHIHTYT